MIRILQHGCLPPRCQIWTDMFQQVRAVDVDDTHALHRFVCTHAHARTHTQICPRVQRHFSRQANASRRTRQLSQAEKCKNVLLGGDAVSHTAVQNKQLSVQLKTRGQKARVVLFNFHSFVNCEI